MSTAFCVGAPWNSVAVDLGIGHILHFDSEIFARAAEKYLGVRQRWAEENPDIVRRLVRAHQRAADFVEDAEQPRRGRGSARGAEPHRGRRGGDPPHARRPAEGLAGRHLPLRRALSPGRPRRARRAPIRRRRPGSTPRWCAGDRRRCRARCWPPPRRCAGPIFTMPRWLDLPRIRSSRPTASARSPDQRSIPTTSRRISRPGTSSAHRWGMIFSENRPPSSIGVEDMLFGIMPCQRHRGMLPEPQNWPTIAQIGEERHDPAQPCSVARIVRDRSPAACFRAGLADQDHHGDRAARRGQRERHHRARRDGAGRASSSGRPSWSRTGRAPAARSAPTWWRRRRPTATRSWSTARSPARTRSIPSCPTTR